MLQLILVRHGETDSSKKGTYCGWTDVELNQKGIEQANQISQKLKGIEISKIYSSPLKRALKTAQIINQELKSKIVCSEALKERNFGEWDDLYYKDICARFPNELKLWQQDWVNYSIKGGESAIQSYNRAVGFVDDLIKHNSCGMFLLVTHLGSIRSIIAHLMGLGIEGIWRFRVDNGSISKLMVNDEKYAYLTGLNM